MISVREALGIVVREVPILGLERVGLLDAAGRVLAEDVRSARDVPGYVNSAMDGYAVRYDDLAQLPKRLRVVGTAAAGSHQLPNVGPGEAVKINTGAPIPPGADTVIRVEDSRREDSDVWIEAVSGKGSHIRKPGEDIRTGNVILRRGRRITPADVGLLASVGRSLFLAHRRPRVAILSTGNELIEVDQPIAPGQVVNSNAYTLAAAVSEAGAIPVILPIARDAPDEIRGAFYEAARYDAILSTGGVSMGEFDYVKAVMDEIGVQRSFWRVAQKPGKPLTFGTLGGRTYFGLPGNPVSSLVCFYVYVRPALRRMTGLAALHLPTVEAILSTEVKKAEGLTEFVRCRLESRDSSLIAVSTGTQSSGVLSSMSQGQGLIVGPPEPAVLPAGSSVRVILLDSDAATIEAPV